MMSEHYERGPWSCSKCSFRHLHHQARCVMCNTLKNASNEQMRAFIAGKTLQNNSRKHDSASQDEVEILMVVEAPGPTEPQNLLVDHDVAPSSADGALRQSVTSNTPRNKENQKQPSVASRSPPSATTAAKPWFAQRGQQSTAATKRYESNPYAKQKQHSYAASNPGSASLSSARNEVSTTRAIPQPAAAAAAANIDDNSWQHLSTATAHSRAVLPLHPPAPPRQSPMRTTTPADNRPAPFASSNAILPSNHSTGVAFSAQQQALRDHAAFSAIHPSGLAAHASNNVASSFASGDTSPSSHTTGQASVASRPPPQQKTALSLLKYPSSSKGAKTGGPKVLPVVKSMAYAPGPVPHCPEAAKTWIYPQHPSYPARQYQLEITETALLHNTLVSLPTGLGKTLIAAVVMYNYFRWFPTGKVIFLAPTLPLVNQQVQACYKIMGLPASDTAVMTGKLSREKRMEYWNQRRVFYCTPQTVQKDLMEKQDSNGDGDQDGSEEAPTVPSAFANQVVCLVLDEAHKATGEYAYVKVVEQLEAAGAKFRIVGLSATPGTSIKAVQQVVQALRTNKIEARQEDDPSVKPYRHDKQFEVILVKPNSAQVEVERRLTDIVAPVLQQLRDANALHRVSGDRTLTSFNIMECKRKYAKQTGGNVPGVLLGLYNAAQKLVDIRNDAHQSLGVVRTKLYRLKTEPQRGVLSTIVKGEAFADLVKVVEGATYAGPGASLSQQNGYMQNNPKLQMLSETLQHHFKGADACGKSSRVIVFSQFRDSVREIVLMLRTHEPIIRPHHFVGQGKAAKGGTNAKKMSATGGDDDVRLDGMKQPEQQKVIQEFRNDVYNVLVCTCIGEEGLDIGEVDLIVNYDTLRSPIRMIQRTGRTGRQRNGRVVCLVTEGQEERTYQQSKVAEKTLFRALKCKTNFVMNADVPLLPTPPLERQFVGMEVVSQIHLSQVAGANLAATRKSSSVNSTKFKLDTSEEQERQQRLGKLVTLDASSTPWRTLRRFLIRNRSTRRSHGGRTVRMLQALEHLGRTHDTASRPSRANSSIQKLFPTEKPLNRVKQGDSTDSDIIDAPDQNETTGKPTLQSAAPASGRNHSSEIPVYQLFAQTAPSGERGREANDGIGFASNPQLSIHPSRPSLSEAVSMKNTATATISNLPQEHLVSTHPRTLVEAHNERAKDPPWHFGPESNNEENSSENMNAIRQGRDTATSKVPVAKNGCLQTPTPGPTSEPEPIFRLPTPPPSSSEEESVGEEEREDESRDVHEFPRFGQEVGFAPLDVYPHTNLPNSPVEQPSTALKIGGGASGELRFRLPTQDSSSEDEVDSEDEEPPCVERQDQIAASLCESPVIVNEDPGAKTHCSIAPIGENSVESDIEAEDVPLISLRTKKRRKAFKSPNKSPKSRKQTKSQSPRRNRAGANLTPGKSHASILQPGQNLRITMAPASTTSKPSLQHSASSMGLSPSPEIAARSKRYQRLFLEEDGESQLDAFTGACQSTSPANQTPEPRNLEHSEVLALQDTPVGPRSAVHQICSKRAADALHGGVGQAALTDTPQTLSVSGNIDRSQIDAENLSCAVCLSLESLDEDPIVICDGCDLGFHKSCYSIDIDLDAVENWFCDTCSSRNQVYAHQKSCMLCGDGKGAMKLEGNGWCHPVCLPFLGNTSLTSRPCRQCSSEGGARCFSCPESMHPYCAIHKRQKDCWTVVLVKRRRGDPEGRVKASLFCPSHANNANIFISLYSDESGETPLPSVTVIQTKEVATPKKYRNKPKRLKRSRATSSGVARDSGDGGDPRVARVERLRRQRQGASIFVLEEAEVGSDDDGDEDEEDALRRMEEDEESNDSFINDSTELSQHFSQDALGEVDPDAAVEVDFYHRALDVQREREQLYKTPLLNRRMNNPDQSQFSSSSEKGLGNMHFVRSVLEHHRQGGKAEEIEQFYRQIAEEEEAKSDASGPSSSFDTEA